MNDNKQEAKKWLEKGLELDRKGNLEDALSAFEKTIELEPKNIWAWGNKGVIFDTLGRYEKALEMFKKVIELEPQNALAWISKGTVLVKVDRNEEALESFKKAIELAPENTLVALAWTGKGVVLGVLNQPAEALKSFEQSLKLNPNDALVWAGKGWALCDLTRFEEALVAFDEALNLNPENTVKEQIIKTQERVIEVKSEEISLEFVQPIQEYLKKYIMSMVYSGSLNIFSPTSKSSQKKPIANFPTPLGTKWEDVTIRFVSDTEIKITVGFIHKNFNFAEIGFKDSRKGDVPDNQWRVLQYLAKCNGEISWKSETDSLKDFPKFPKRIETIRKRLISIMGIDDDPFYDYKKLNSYKSKFTIEDISGQSN